MTTMKSKIFLYMAMCLMLLIPRTAKAQLGFDIVSVEAYINDHKEQRSLLLVRSTLEASNKLLHDYSGDANIDYKDINKEFLLEDMVDKMQTLKAGIEPVEIVDIETEKQL